MTDLAVNLRRLMARNGFTLPDLMRCSGLHERTLKGILAGTNKPHARTLHRLAAGLGVSADELFQDPSLLAYRAFDRETNPLVEEVVAGHRHLFAGWCEADFDELYSRFGTGGGLTLQGTLEAVRAMNHKREVHQKAALLLETSECGLLSGFVELLYQKVAVCAPPIPRSVTSVCHSQANGD